MGHYYSLVPRPPCPQHLSLAVRKVGRRPGRTRHVIHAMIDITTTNKLCIECAHCADMSLRPWTARDKSWVWRPGNEAGSVQVIGKSTHLADVNWFATADLHTHQIPFDDLSPCLVIPRIKEGFLWSKGMCDCLGAPATI